jgi:hypothetical protein
MAAVLIQCLSACKKEAYPHALRVADSLICVKPDSAVTLLSQLKDTLSMFNKSTQMYYRLLCIKADDKAYIPHTSDSLILALIDYYDVPGRRTHLTEVYYYAGRVYRDLQDAPPKPCIICRKQSNECLKAVTTTCSI